MWLDSFVDVNIFVVKYYFISFVYSLHFLEFLKSKSIEMLKPQKGNSEVSFNDTLLKFGLRDSENLQTLDYCEILSKSPFRLISENIR